MQHLLDSNVVDSSKFISLLWCNLKIGDGEDIRIFHDGTNNIFRFGTDKELIFKLTQYL